MVQVGSRQRGGELQAGRRRVVQERSRWRAELEIKSGSMQAEGYRQGLEQRSVGREQRRQAGRQAGRYEKRTGREHGQLVCTVHI